jgi:predicted anti-sigma-YlaC factor YlaD
MECERWREAISAMVDGETSGIDEALVTAHLEHCAGCREFRASSERLRRASRLQSAPHIPDLSAQIVAAHAMARRTSRWGLVRVTLAVVAVEIVVLSVPRLLAGGDGDLAHGDRHLGAFSVAYSVALLVVVVRPARARTVLPVAAVLAATLLITAVVDGVRGEIPLLKEAEHLPELLSVALVWILATAGRRPIGDRSSAKGPAQAIRAVPEERRRIG